MHRCKELLNATSEKPDQKWIDRSLADQDFWFFGKKWIERVIRHSKRPTDEFEGLIYLWIIFNAWSSLVISSKHSNTDAKQIAVLSYDATLYNRFEELKAKDSDFRAWSEEFGSLWPIFRIKELHDAYGESDAHWQNDTPRSDYVANVFSHLNEKGKTLKHYPPCFRRHREGGEDVPNDWAHTLSAIYQVRCNLFHGGKDFQKKTHIRFVSLSFRILWRVWRKEVPWVEKSEQECQQRMARMSQETHV